jgi:hypothetical protein
VHLGSELVRLLLYADDLTLLTMSKEQLNSTCCPLYANWQDLCLQIVQRWAFRDVY